MSKIVCIVEGDGEVASLPILLRRLALWRSSLSWIEIERPIRVKRDRFLNREEEFNRYVSLAVNKSESDGWVLILLDADDDCPAELSGSIKTRVERLFPQHNFSVVLANREYESWFIASIESLNGKRGLKIAAADDLNADAENYRDAKGWIRQRMKDNSYGPTTDQPAFTSLMELQSAHDRSRSFRKLCKEWDSCFINKNQS
jgi:hypothetical protein